MAKKDDKQQYTNTKKKENKRPSNTNMTKTGVISDASEGKQITALHVSAFVMLK